MGQIWRYRFNYDIIDVEVQDNLLFIVYDLENAKPGSGSAAVDVLVFDNKARFRRLLRITYESVKNYPNMSVDRWVPEKVLLSEEYENVMFLELNTADLTSNSILALYIDDRGADFIYHRVFDSEVEAFVTGESLFVYKVDAGIIEEHSLRNLNKISFMKQLPQYGYSIIRNRVYRSDSDLLYAIAVLENSGRAPAEPGECGVYALIYHSHHVLIDSLYAVLPIDCDEDLMGLNIHIDGINKDTMVVVNDGTLQFFRIPQAPAVAVAADLDKDVYLEEFTYHVLIKPWYARLQRRRHPQFSARHHRFHVLRAAFPVPDSSLPCPRASIWRQLPRQGCRTPCVAEKEKTLP